MKFNNEKGFTVVELILSFTLVMFLAISMFALVNNYKERQQMEALNRDLLNLKTSLTQDIYEDAQKKKVKKINYCLDDDNKIIKRCLNIEFMDNTEKQLKIDNKAITVNEDGTTFSYDALEFVYGNVKYNNPDPKFISIVPDDILTYTTNGEIEYGTIYKISIKLRHQDIVNDYIIEIITTGKDSPMAN